MMNRLRAVWRNLNASLWFVPSWMVAASIGLAFGLVELDVWLGHAWIGEGWLLVGSGADGARGMLATIAGSMMTVAALTFSLTLATLAQVSSQYTSRVLRNFMRNRANQLVLGFFVSVFVYCLVVLRTVRSGDEGSFVPAVAVTMGLGLSLLAIGVLVFFIHHIASSIQAANIVSEVARETDDAITRLYPEELSDSPDADGDGDGDGDGDELDRAEDQGEAGGELLLLRPASSVTWLSIPSKETGYVQDIDGDALLAVARRLGTNIRLERAIGGFVARGADLVSVAQTPDESEKEGENQSENENEAHALDESTLEDIHDAFSVGHQRTIEQDVGFGLRQIVDIALKALSPGVNDVTTAVICIDHLGALLASLSTRCLADPLRRERRGDQEARDREADDAGRPRVRVLAARPTFDSFVQTALNQIRVAGDKNVAVYLRLLSALETAAARIDTPARARVVRDHVRRIEEAASRTLATDEEKSQVRTRAESVEHRLRSARGLVRASSGGDDTGDGDDQQVRVIA
jgi:uncharacterized membrane protein